MNILNFFKRSNNQRKQQQQETQQLHKRVTEYFCNNSISEAMSECRANGYQPISVTMGVDRIEQRPNGNYLTSRNYYVVIGERYVKAKNKE